METLQRIYGISFPDSKMMKDWEKFQEEAKSRDHRKIGKVRRRLHHRDMPWLAVAAPHSTGPHSNVSSSLC
jgi:threonyl-tRNA synthetase